MSVYHSTLVATNLPFRRWGDFLPSGTQAVVIAGRLIDRATILRFSGKPFRNPQDIHGGAARGRIVASIDRTLPRR